jgi:hypothetical protein
MSGPSDGFSGTRFGSTVSVLTRRRRLLRAAPGPNKRSSRKETVIFIFKFYVYRVDETKTVVMEPNVDDREKVKGGSVVVD